MQQEHEQQHAEPDDGSADLFDVYEIEQHARLLSGLVRPAGLFDDFEVFDNEDLGEAREVCRRVHGGILSLSAGLGRNGSDRADRQTARESAASNCSR